MSIRPTLQPINARGPRTGGSGGTVPGPVSFRDVRLAIALLALALAVTLGIATRDPLLGWTYDIGIFSTASAVSFRAAGIAPRFLIPLTGIALWGFAQLAVGATSYRWATFEASLRLASYAATALVAAQALGPPGVRELFLKALAWIGAAIGTLSTMAYFTSRSTVLWFFPSPYPDVWGPFLSRNNFAQFLEMCLPAALFLGLKHTDRKYLAMAAAMFAAGIASASRAGALLLVVESVTVLLLTRGWRRALGRALRWFAAPALVFAGITGAGVLLGRFADPDPLRVRREIFRSSIAMITAHPLRGYGLGNFPVVYPEFAEFDSGAAVEHAHNDWLEWTAEGGLGFTVQWAGLAIALCLPAVRSIWGIGVISAFLHALVDYPFARHGTAVWLFLLAGALMAAHNRGSERSVQQRHYLKGAHS
jgi:O-antigen ligase